jgi:hypothetical protein
MALTKQAHQQALKIVNNLYIRAIAKDNEIDYDSEVGSGT